jgi:hypothetical protein
MRQIRGAPGVEIRAQGGSAVAVANTNGGNALANANGGNAMVGSTFRIGAPSAQGSERSHRLAAAQTILALCGLLLTLASVLESSVSERLVANLFEVVVIVIFVLTVLVRLATRTGRRRIDVVKRLAQPVLKRR